MRLAVSRTPRARGRIKRLIVSTITRVGTSGFGVPSGRRWPKAAVGLFRRPMITVASHRGRASAMLRDSWVVGVNVYGSRPNILMEVRKTINDANIRAHLCPVWLSGRSSC